jgi:hypothetical protein
MKVTRRWAVTAVAETVLVHLIGVVNQAVFQLTRGRVVLYRFHGSPALLVTVTGSKTPRLRTETVPCLRDGDDYIVLAAPDEADRPGWAATLLAVEPADIITVETGSRSFDAEVTRLGAADSAAMMDRLLQPLSLGERHTVRHQRLVPVARLTIAPPPDAAIAGSSAFML